MSPTLMDLTFSAAVVTLFIIAAAAAWPAMYATWSRIVASDAHGLNLWQMVWHRGLSRKDLAGREREVARAMYRCIACHEAARCDEQLASGRFDEVEAFCPNRPLLDELTAKRLRT